MQPYNYEKYIIAFPSLRTHDANNTCAVFEFDI